MIGQTIGHYEVEERLGGGGMGVVYRARDRKLGRLVALKFLSPHLVASEPAKQRFIAEARAASALDHPSIATIHAIEETRDGELYIVMAYYEGETIAARLARRGAIPVGQALELALQAAEGIARAHEQGIVHRDVKPANLMITPDGRVKVLDFGLAKVEDVRLTDAGPTVGTPAYLSPEQVRGSRVDHRTDVWSLGVVLYEMLTGRLPFPGEHREQVLDAVLHADPTPPSHWTSVAPDLEAVIVRALSRSPGARHRTMAALLEELRAVRDGRLGASSADTLVQPVSSAGRAAATPAPAARAALTPFVGREEDLALVVARFELAQEGQGQAVLVTGEPGIGKSRLLHELYQRLRERPHLLLECRSSPYHTNDALHPITEMLSRLAGLEGELGSEVKREKLAKALEPVGATPDTVDLLALALSLPPDEARSPLELTPQKRKQKTLEALLQLVLAAAARRPVVLVVEDLHWLDPSSDEVLDALVRQATSAAVLVIATARPGTTPAWGGEEHVTRLALRRLSRLQTERLVERVAGSGGLPAAIVEQVLSRTDGIPLFAEELTRAICDAAAADGEGKRPSAEALATFVPATLQESLAARLDRLGPVKGTAQLAAVLGREFPLPWLEAVSPLSADALCGELEHLVDSGLLQPRGPAPAASYLFKHALVQEAAYASLLKTTRQQYHEKMARALEEQFPETAAAQPHLVAHHHTEAGQAPAATLWWSRAAGRAAERFASREAVANLRRALELLATLPEGPERNGHQLGLQMGLCALLPSVSGYTSAETEQAYLRAQELCDQAGRVAENFFVHHGLWAFHLVCGRLAVAHERARAVHEAARERGDTLSVLDGHYALGCTLADIGELEASLHHLEQGMATDEADPGRTPSYHAGMELGVVTPSFSVMPLWLLGRADAALERAQRTADKARKLGHPLSLAFALYYVTWAHIHRGEAARAAETAREIVKLSEQHGLFFAPLGSGMLGWALDQEASLVAAWRAPRARDVEASPANDADFERVASSLRFYRASGAVLNVPFMLWLVALGHARRRRFTEARASVAEALAIVAETGEIWWQSELERLSGELALAIAVTGAGLASERREAETAFVRAGEIAARQQALALELRAALSLACLRRDEGRAAEGRALLAPVVARFTEGHATGDLVAVRALLAERS